MRYIIMLLFLTMGSLSSVSAFTDIENSWYKDSISELKESGLVSGYGDGRFGPDDNVTRAEILAIILNAAQVEIPEIGEEECFPDVKNDMWYAPYVCYAAEQEITSGYEDGNFKPNGSVSVIESLAFVGGVFELDVPKDDDDNPWYTDYIAFAHDEKIIPQNAYTINTLGKRGQISDIITRAKKVSEDEVLHYRSTGCVGSNSLKEQNSLVINGITRSYILDLPDNYSIKTAYPVVVGLHGRTNSNAMVQDYMGLMGGGWKGIEKQNVISLYPAGLGAGPYTWHQSENIDFFDAMISQVAQNLCIDKSEVHIVGHSLGAYFSNKLSCERGDVIHTMTAVAGSGVDLDCRGPVASLILHNRADRLAPYSGSEYAVKVRKEKNLCSGEAKSTNIGGLNCELYSHCSVGNPVAFCTEYETYGDVPHSRPKLAAKAVYEFIDMEK